MFLVSIHAIQIQLLNLPLLPNISFGFKKFVTNQDRVLLGLFQQPRLTLVGDLLSSPKIKHTISEVDKVVLFCGRTSTSSNPTLIRSSLLSAPRSEVYRCSMSDSTPPSEVAGCFVDVRALGNYGC